MLMPLTHPTYACVNRVVIIDFRNKKIIRVWGGSNGITFTSNVMKIGQLDHKQKGSDTHKPIYTEGEKKYIHIIHR